MPRQNVDPMEYAEYWIFWLWQYTSRNPEYLDAYNKYHNDILPLQSDNEKRKAFEQRCMEQFGVCPYKDPNDNSSIKKILSEALHGHLRKELDGFIDVFEGDYYLRRVDLEKSTFVNNVGMDSDGIQVYIADLDRPLPDLIAELSYWHNKSEASSYIPFLLDDTADVEQQYIEFMKKEDAKIIYHSIKKIFQLDDIPRAIGLWLWDYRHQSLNEGDSVTIADAINELCADTDYDLAGYRPQRDNYDSALRRLRRYYKMTDESIKKMEVLSVTP